MIPTQRSLPTNAGTSPPFVSSEIFLFTPGITGRGRKPEDVPEFVVIENHPPTQLLIPSIHGKNMSCETIKTNNMPKYLFFLIIIILLILFIFYDLIVECLAEMK
jgi:hypothetical protein